MILTFSGKAESGKTTAVNFIKEAFREEAKFLEMNFGDRLKDICRLYYGWDGKKDVAGRMLLQIVGTQKFRQINPNYWVEEVRNFIKMVDRDFDYFLIGDARFPNEIEGLKDYFPTTTIQIVRPNFNNHLTPEQRRHPSETSLDDYNFDYVIYNDGSLEDFYRKISATMLDIMKKV